MQGKKKIRKAQQHHTAVEFIFPLCHTAWTEKGELTIFKEQGKWHLTETKQWPEMTLEGSRSSLRRGIDPGENQTTHWETSCGPQSARLLACSDTLRSLKVKDTMTQTQNTTHLTAKKYLFVYTNTMGVGRRGVRDETCSPVKFFFSKSPRINFWLNRPVSPTMSLAIQSAQNSTTEQSTRHETHATLEFSPRALGPSRAKTTKSPFQPFPNTHAFHEVTLWGVTGHAS